MRFPIKLRSALCLNASIRKLTPITPPIIPQVLPVLPSEEAFETLEGVAVEVELDFATEVTVLPFASVERMVRVTTTTTAVAFNSPISAETL